jgi:hypothetical protein
MMTSAAIAANPASLTASQPASAQSRSAYGTNVIMSTESASIQSSANVAIGATNLSRATNAARKPV